MSLIGGDLTTPARVAGWLTGGIAAGSPVLAQIIGSMSRSIYGKINRAPTFSQDFTRIFNGTGTDSIVLPDYPVTRVTSVQVGAAAIQPSALPSLTAPATATLGYGWRFVPWQGDLPGQNAVLEFNNGLFYQGSQNVAVAYTAGYLVANEAQTIPLSPGPYEVTVNQYSGICCKDAGVTYAATGEALVAVRSSPSVGQYIPPPDATPGLYTFAAADAGVAILISYSFVPADLEEACIQMVAERLSYRSRVGVTAQVLGGQETIHYMRTRARGAQWPDLPPEVEDLLMPYLNVVPPAIGAFS